jgi:hypothetical protein
MSQSRQVLPCPSCGTQLRMPTGKLGKITCPTCKTPLSADTTSPNGTLQIQAQATRRIATSLASIRDWFWRRRYAFALPVLLILLFSGLPITTPTPTQVPAPVSSPINWDAIYPPVSRSAVTNLPESHPHIEPPLVEQARPSSGEAWICADSVESCEVLPTDLDGAPFEVKSSSGVDYLLTLTSSPELHVLVFVRGG